MKRIKHKSNPVDGFRRPLPELSFDNLRDSLCPFFEAVNTPTSLGLWLCLKYDDANAYLAYDINPLNYLDAYAFRMDYQCAKLLAKYPGLPTGINTKLTAEKTFIDCERHCREINSDIIQYGFFQRLNNRNGSEERAVIHSAIRKISNILGDAPELVDLKCSFGPGLNVGLSNNNTSLHDKLMARPSVTSALDAQLSLSGQLHPAWDSIHCENSSIPSVPFTLLSQRQVVPGSRLSFVPKNAKTDRPICVEPLINGYYQSGIGSAIRTRLLKAGCNLRSQTRNQRLSRYGSITDDLATVDLSSASDTISYMVVMNLLPDPWFSLLDITRSPSFTYQGKNYPLEKISSMGNGFTFELESLIFLTLARSVCEQLKLPTDQVNTYGDDIIIPSAAYDLLHRVLATLGFVVNEEKSFSHGPFRESCGSDWFLGTQVRPLFLKDIPTPAKLISWCNTIRRQDTFGVEPLYVLWMSLRTLVPKFFLNLEGPDDQGDGHFVVALSEYGHNRAHSRRKRGWEGVGFNTIRTSPRLYRNKGTANYAIALYNAQNPSESQTIIPKNWDGVSIRRGKVRDYLTRSFAHWKDISAW
jgi:hypothetical protein